MRNTQTSSPKRLLLFVHYNQWGNLADYVVYLLKHVRKIFARVVLISNSPLSEEARHPLTGLYDDFLQRENTGFDFLAWKDALLREGQEHLAAYDSVTLMNDTCFGPLFDMRAVYHRMEREGADFWGLTNYRATESGMPGTNDPVPEHIQSYFLCFNKKAALSDAFQTFWKAVQHEDDVTSVIQKYETQLTGYLQKTGLSSSVLCDTTGMEAPSPNLSASVPEVLLQQGVPLIKVKAFFQHTPPENAFLLSLVHKACRYPVAMIHDHLARHFAPDESIRAVGHSLEGRLTRCQKAPPSQRVALHIHVFYPDMLRGILTRFSRCVHTPVDLVLTTDSVEKAAVIRRMLERDFPRLRVRKLLICENRGRDVWPWLRVAPLLAEYDLAGHIHTKKTPNAHSRFGRLWLSELLECLIGRFEPIRNAFARDPFLGIVIPDIPSSFMFPPHLYSYGSDTVMKTLLPSLWKRIGCQRTVDFTAKKMLVFPYGNMFWYRPAALKPLWCIPWAPADMPEEPIPTHGTLLHALERLPVYVAWDQGYDFRIARQARVPLGFQYDRAMSEHSNKTADTRLISYLRAQTRRRLSAKPA